MTKFTFLIYLQVASLLAVALAAALTLDLPAAKVSLTTAALTARGLNILAATGALIGNHWQIC